MELNKQTNKKKKSGNMKELVVLQEKKSLMKHGDPKTQST